ncbi:MAG: hypothetical protein OXT74_16660 [Candidatus Poribacteria bacterium]|nr:hypothetical protein [Candidatus Poribacteria bacterium]
MERKKRGGRFFVGIVVIEHIVFGLLMALAIAPKSPPRPKESAINVAFVKNETLRKKIKTETPIPVPNVRKNQPSETLPQIQPTTNLSEYLATTQTEGGLPKLRRTQASSENPERLSLGAPLSKGRSKGDFLDEPNALVRSKPLEVETGYHGRDSHRGLPERDMRRSITGEGGKALAGRFAPGKLSEMKTNLITEGVPYEISGEVSGRAVISGLEKPLQSKGKQGGGVHLSFKVRPDGSVFSVQIKPGRTTIGEVRLKERARRYVEQIRFSALPKNVSQVVQSGEIFINFTVN